MSRMQVCSLIRISRRGRGLNIPADGPRLVGQLLQQLRLFLPSCPEEVAGDEIEPECVLQDEACHDPGSARRSIRESRMVTVSK